MYTYIPAVCCILSQKFRSAEDAAFAGFKECLLASFLKGGWSWHTLKKRECRGCNPLPGFKGCPLAPFLKGGWSWHILKKRECRGRSPLPGFKGCPLAPCSYLALCRIIRESSIDNVTQEASVYGRSGATNYRRTGHFYCRPVRPHSLDPDYTFPGILDERGEKAHGGCHRRVYRQLSRLPYYSWLGRHTDLRYGVARCQRRVDFLWLCTLLLCNGFSLWNFIRCDRCASDSSRLSKTSCCSRVNNEEECSISCMAMTNSPVEST